MVLDALLYILLAILPASVAVFASDEAAKYIAPQNLFWIKNAISILGVAFGSLKAFRSMAWAQHIDRQTADKARDNRREDEARANRLEETQLITPQPLMIRLALLTPLLLALSLTTGCMSTSALIRELAKDQATVSVRVTTVYGTVYYTRTNPGTNTLVHSIEPDGSVRIGGQR